MINNNKNQISDSKEEIQDDQELYLGDFLVGQSSSSKRVLID